MFGRSIDEFTVSFFTRGRGSTLPMAIWGQLRGGVSPTVNAISSRPYYRTAESCRNLGHSTVTTE